MVTEGQGCCGRCGGLVSFAFHYYVLDVGRGIVVITLGCDSSNAGSIPVDQPIGA